MNLRFRYAAFCSSMGSRVHVANLTRSTMWSAVALCGKSFADFTEVKGGGQATCAKCRRLDDPFRASLDPYDPRQWTWILANTGIAAPNARTALLTRDLITVDGKVTSRGAILARDLADPTPWVDSMGIVHARRPGGIRGHGACGADLLGIGDMTYERLGRMHGLYEDADVTCMACAAIGAAAP
jgi:hypothetical protein